MIHEIMPHRLDNSFRVVEPKNTDFCLCFCNGMVLLHRDRGPSPAIPRLCELKQFSKGNSDYLFSVDDAAFFEMHNLPETDDLAFYSMDIVFSLEKHMAFPILTAYQLHRWKSTHKFCGQCSQPMQKGLLERSLVCNHCQNIEYPKIAPVVMVGIMDGQGKLLLTRYANREYSSHALVAGFVEIGETLEEAARREAKEEVGLDIVELQYYKSQPWALTDSIIAGFFARIAGNQTITLDRTELAEAEWFDRENLPDDLSNISIAYDMIEAFRNGAVQ